MVTDGDAHVTATIHRDGRRDGDAALAFDSVASKHANESGVASSDDLHNKRVQQPATLLALCCLAVQALGMGPQAEMALGERERWHEVRMGALGSLAETWPCLARRRTWDLAWYRPETVDLVGCVRNIDRTDRRLFPARNQSTMGIWLYAHADGRPAPRITDTGRTCTELLLRGERQMDGAYGREDIGRGPIHVCSLSLPKQLVLDDVVARLIARRGGPRPTPGADGLVAGLRFVSQPCPLLVRAPHLLTTALRWPPGRYPLPVVPAYPFDHVVVAEWERNGMHGLVCVNANPAATHDYGRASLIYMGAETFYAPCAVSFSRLAHLFAIDCRSTCALDPAMMDVGQNCADEKNCDFFSWAMQRCAHDATIRL